MRIVRVLALSAALVAGAAAGATAQVFNSGIPFGYTCTGNCGVASTPDGSITAVPNGSLQVGYVVSNGSSDNPLDINVATNGAHLISSPFSGTIGQTLSFYFQYITSDGAGYSDFAFVRLLSSGDPLTLFTARTTPSGNTVPGFDMPAIASGVVVNPATVTITGGTFFSGLGGWTGSCFDVGCGHTGWVTASYDLVASGSYQLQFGVNNYDDGEYDSALLFDYALGQGGTPTIEESATPEPASMVLLATGLLGVAGIARRKSRA